MRVYVAAMVACLLVAGCKGKDAGSGSASRTEAAPGAPSASAGRPTTAVDPATLGNVSGTVRFVGKEPVPVKIDTSMDPACGMGGAAEFSSEQYAVKDGRLGNVYVYVKSGPPAMTGFAGEDKPVVMDQKGCRYTPHVVAVMQGGSVEFRNSDVTMHNIHTMPTTVGNEAIDISQGPKGAPIVKQFKNAEVMLPVRCNNHPWMNAFINVSPTPFFAVTDEAGKFSIKGLPEGEYVLAAVHEKLGEQTTKVKVTAKGEVKGDFTFTVK